MSPLKLSRRFCFGECRFCVKECRFCVNSEIAKHRVFYKIVCVDHYAVNVVKGKFQKFGHHTEFGHN